MIVIKQHKELLYDPLLYENVNLMIYVNKRVAFALLMFRDFMLF